MESLTFASSSNILRLIRKNYPEIITETIPGISIFSAASALCNFNLAIKGETLIVKECPSNKEELIDLINENKGREIVIVLMKVGKRWPLVKDVLQKEDIINKSVVALNVGTSDQKVQKAAYFNSIKMPYFSLILIRFL